MFNISKHIFPFLKFVAVAGSPEPKEGLAHSELDAVAAFVAQTDVEITGLAIVGESWARCDITQEPCLCYQVEMVVAAYRAKLAKPAEIKPPVRNYYKDALHIQGGACNPRAVINTLHGFLTNWLKEADSVSICNDPGVRLIVHQLAHLMNTHSLSGDMDDYESTVKRCEALAKCPNLTYISKSLWPAVAGGFEDWLTDQDHLMVRDFLERYPDGQKFEIIFEQFGKCDISNRVEACYVVQPVQPTLEAGHE